MPLGWLLIIRPNIGAAIVRPFFAEKLIEVPFLAAPLTERPFSSSFRFAIQSITSLFRLAQGS